MAKKSITARQRKREKLVAQHAEKRAELKKAGDWKALDEMPKNSSKVRLKNRCQITGLHANSYLIHALPVLLPHHIHFYVPYVLV